MMSHLHVLTISKIHSLVGRKFRGQICCKRQKCLDQFDKSYLNSVKIIKQVTSHKNTL